ncbi:2-hydroxyphytanoyl lyase [Fusarium subglutinans]|uniref:2-hydroxyphytanoyl lyase n=1 Tax=Gibberella subglutinans TaxID=42677 RepID=A0A8H5LBB5_GIBSU|nr:2-hydroxyphytanoyl lyase [Fusarium subglutinans]KAF5589845.1 2-hydroxyphytanoyl lyase [Fusarium subglutinans]
MATDSTSSPQGLGALTTTRNDTNLSRRERKRASDRMSQQASRAKTKAYIAHLERSVARLTEAQNNSGLNVSEQLRQQFDEIAGLKQTLSQIAKLAANSISQQNSGDNLDDSPSRPPASSNDKDSRHFPDTYNPACHPHQESLDRLYPALDLNCGDKQRDYFQAFSQALDTIESEARGHVFSGPEIDDDINIRAVLDGWDAARARNPFDIGWLMLQTLDEGFLWRSGAVERMATLRVIRSMLMVKLNPQLPPSRRPPVYMNPRPEVRDYLILFGINYAPESLAAQFASDIGFRWPYDLRDTCRYQPAKGVYSFSEDFNLAYRNLDSWYMKSALVTTYIPPLPSNLLYAGSDDDHWLKQISGESQPSPDSSLRNEEEGEQDWLLLTAMLDDIPK